MDLGGGEADERRSVVEVLVALGGDGAGMSGVAPFVGVGGGGLAVAPDRDGGHEWGTGGSGSPQEPVGGDRSALGGTTGSEEPDRLTEPQASEGEDHDGTIVRRRPRAWDVLGKAGPRPEGADRVQHRAEPVIEASEALVVPRPSRGLLVVPDGERHGTTKARRSRAPERDGDGDLAPTQSGNVMHGRSVADRPDKLSCAEIGDVDGGDHRCTSVPAMGTSAH